jgi:hypothetical protein
MELPVACFEDTRPAATGGQFFTKSAETCSGNFCAIPEEASVRAKSTEPLVCV